MRRPIITATAVFALILGACGGSSASTSTSETMKKSASSSKSSSDSTSYKAIDTCALATDADIAALGASGPSAAFDRPETPGLQWDSCTWGSLTGGKPVVVIQTVQRSRGTIDAMGILLKAGDTAREPATPSNVGKGAMIYNVAILAGGGGGGVGKTLAFTAGNGTEVAVSVTGSTVDTAALTTLAEQVNAKLG